VLSTVLHRLSLKVLHRLSLKVLHRLSLKVLHRLSLKVLHRLSLKVVHCPSIWVFQWIIYDAVRAPNASLNRAHWLVMKDVVLHLMVCEGKMSCCTLWCAKESPVMFAACRAKERCRDAPHVMLHLTPCNTRCRVASHGRNHHHYCMGAFAAARRTSAPLASSGCTQLQRLPSASDHRNPIIFAFADQIFDSAVLEL
jgi:hypothetical protein